MTHIFLTGFPGFIGKHLAFTLIKKYSDLKLTFLVHPSMQFKARQEFKALKLNPDIHKIVLGDITQPNLGLMDTQAQDIQTKTNTIFHLAAIYDLTVPEDIAQKVNVQGTQNLLTFFSKSPNLQRFNHISTCYVSGNQKGLITPDKLEENQKFHNFYESTKQASEVLVKKRNFTMPVTIFRPAIVVGDSLTGETDKFDGPYVVIAFLHKIRALLRLVPNLGYSECEVNTVPVDYVTDVISYLAFQKHALGKTYQVCDQNPPSTKDFFETMVHMIGGLTPYSCSILKIMILKILCSPLVSKITGITPQHLDYFMHPGKYRDPHLIADLKDSGITLSSYKTYYPKLYHFLKLQLSAKN
ncbi:MAG: SDR family oxidoreductase [Deltaproteobacteria bacterium]|nr:SDR family oxidoreductase [Deltaproteobacteria bacterium]